MAAPYNPPVKNQDFSFTLGLTDANDNARLKANPTIAAGDFKVSIDGAAFANLGTLPTNSPAGGKALLFVLSSTEMNGDVITVLCSDQTDPPEWADLMYTIITTV